MSSIFFPKRALNASRSAPCCASSNATAERTVARSIARASSRRRPNSSTMSLRTSKRSLAQRSRMRFPASFETLAVSTRAAMTPSRSSLNAGFATSRCSFRSWLASDVGGGLTVYIAKFFRKDCLHCMKLMSKTEYNQFKDLVLLFASHCCNWTLSADCRRHQTIALCAAVWPV